MENRTRARCCRSTCKLTGNNPIYGRSAQILVDERPTVQLLEIVKLNRIDYHRDTESTGMQAYAGS